MGRADDRGAAPPLPAGPVRERAQRGRRVPDRNQVRAGEADRLEPVAAVSPQLGTEPPRVDAGRLDPGRDEAVRDRIAVKQGAQCGQVGAGQQAGRTAEPQHGPSVCPGRISKCARPDVHLVRPDAARGAGRGRGAEPPAAAAGRLRPSGRLGRVRLAAARPEGAAQRRADRPRGDGPDRRPGGAVPGAAAARAVRGDRPVDRVRAGRLQGASTGAAPTTCSRRPTRSCSRCWPRPSSPRTRTCRCRSTRCRRSSGTSRGRGRGCCARREFVMKDSYSFDLDRRGARGLVRRPPGGVPADLRPARARRAGRLGGVGGDGRLGVGGVPRADAGRRGHVRLLRAVRLRGQHRGGALAPAHRAGRRAGTGGGAGHPGHADDRDGRRAPRRAGVGDAEEPARRRRSTARSSRSACPATARSTSRRVEAAARAGAASSRRPTSPPTPSWSAATSVRRAWPAATSGTWPTSGSSPGTSWVTGANDPTGTPATWSPAATSPSTSTPTWSPSSTATPARAAARRSPLDRGVEVGHVFQLGRKYTDAFEPRRHPARTGRRSG